MTRQPSEVVRMPARLGRPDAHMVTFGPDQRPEPNAAMIIAGCDNEQARGIALALFGRDWAAIYHGPEALKVATKYPPTLIRLVTISAPRWSPVQN